MPRQNKKQRCLKGKSSFHDQNKNLKALKLPWKKYLQCVIVFSKGKITQNAYSFQTLIFQYPQYLHYSLYMLQICSLNVRYSLQTDLDQSLNLCYDILMIYWDCFQESNPSTVYQRFTKLEHFSMGRGKKPVLKLPAPIQLSKR